MIWDILFKKPVVKQTQKEYLGLVVEYKIYSIKNHKNSYYAEAKYENVIFRSVWKCWDTLMKKKDILEEAETIFSDRMKQIAKEAAQHGVCSCPLNRTKGCMLKFIWDGSKIKEIILSDKKYKVLLETGNKSGRGGLSECYVPIIKGY